METALITGASSGIGLELARQFAKHGHPLFITAPKEAELQVIARELERAHGVFVRFIAKDLEQPHAAQEIYETARLEGVQIDILINNAGLGYMGKFWEVPTEALISMLRVNMEAVVRLTRLFLPEMVRRNKGRLVNTASVASFEPGPTMATYHATKAFVMSLTEALAVELKETNVLVTALCPGPTDTDFIPKAGMIETQLFQRGKVMAPQEVAAIGYEAIMRGDRQCVTGGSNKAQAFARHFFTNSALAKMTKKFYETAPPEKQTRHRGDIEATAKMEELEPAGHNGHK